ncbi:hypothetical protein CPB84DRAFT_1846095 [Gymnopilus junonius]|uniref:Uncharacterized protein n=1 Tax=Gymnopilus junonius TaxID=109634 RepID=A0A9P5NRN7_GYMJU|nr:hypothetical protein CPB84DRAFT_1846095 [Gymnopilus junonius]
MRSEILPAMFNYWHALGKEPRDSDEGKELSEWCTNNWQATHGLTKPSNHFKPTHRSVLWKFRQDDVLKEIAKILNVEMATTETPGWFTAWTWATKQLIKQMTNAELQQLDKQVIEASQKATVEDVFDKEDSELEEDLLEHGFFFTDDLDEDSDDGYDSESDEEEVTADEVYALKNKAAIYHFNQDDAKTSDEEDNDIDASLRRLFPEELQESQNVDLTIEEAEPSSSVPASEGEDPRAEAQKKVEELLRELRNGHHPCDDSPETMTDQLLNRLCYKDFPSLCHACAQLTLKAKDKKINVFFHSHIMAMVATLNFYLDPELLYSWWESSLLAAKALGWGVKHA